MSDFFDLISGWSDATPYMGIRSGVTKQKLGTSDRESRIGHLYEFDDHRNVPGIFGGLRKGDISLEVGGGPLGRRSSHNVSDTYDIRQDIDTDYAYLAGLKHFDLGSFSPHLLGGLAGVNFKNHEYGSNEAGPNQDHRNSGLQFGPMYGFGFTWSPQFMKPLTVRGDYFKIDDVAKSLWTRKSDITGGFLGLQYPF